MKLDDRWTDEPMIQQLSFQSRWHYLGMLSWCCRMDQYDGIMRSVDAWRASDVDDPMKAIQELRDVGLLEPTGDSSIRLTQIDRHALPPYLRDANRKAASRETTKKWRQRQQNDSDDSGDMSLPEDGDESLSRHSGVGVGVGTGTALTSSDETSSDDSREVSRNLRSRARDVPDDIPPGETRNPVGTHSRIKDRACRLVADVLGKKTNDVRKLVNWGDDDLSNKLDGLIEEVLRPALVAGQSDTTIKAALRKARDENGDITEAWEYLEPPHVGDGGWTT
ncbi:hypothetical protein AB1207_01155 [Kineococcus endophyticus]|uniref:Uncharacterized protein n=1 Tax=Kineococcus endophyticus TaxID=1181883 RepID=A0ABV3P160_9ACTN